MANNPADMMPFAKLTGLKILKAEKDLVKGERVVRANLCTSGNILHGGAIMAFADALGAIGGFKKSSRRREWHHDR